MLCPVENEDFSRDSLGRDQVWILGHVSSAIDLSWVIDSLYDLYARLRWNDVATEFAPFVVIVSTVELVGQRARAFGYLDGCDLQVVLCLARGVRAQQQSMDAIRLVGRSETWTEERTSVWQSEGRTTPCRETTGKSSLASRAHG